MKKRMMICQNVLLVVQALKSIKTDISSRINKMTVKEKIILAVLVAIILFAGIMQELGY